jgi:hypothetical protein
MSNAGAAPGYIYNPEQARWISNFEGRPTLTEAQIAEAKAKIAETKAAEIKPVVDTLAERAVRYGEFKGHAQIAQQLKAALHAAPNWSKLSEDKKEALEMIQHKIGRILNGDSNYHDSWHDISGYAKLVADTLI